MTQPVTLAVQKIIEAGQGLSGDPSRAWYGRACEFVGQVFGDGARERLEYLRIRTGHDTGAGIGFLEGLALKAIATDPASSTQHSAQSHQASPSDARADSAIAQVFVVHGHDGEAREKVARYLERLRLDTVILIERAGGGKTIIENIESNAMVDFAVVLLTGDDVGAVATDARHLRARARQNVIFELGYFVGKLGRSRVAILHEQTVEIPSDYHGVLYIPLDEAGGWKLRLAQELVKARLPIDLTRLV